MELAAHLRTLSTQEHLAMRDLKLLSGLGSAERDEFLAAWQRIPPDRRLTIVQAMVELAEDNVDLDFAEPLRWLLDDSSAEVRSTAVDGLWESDSPRVMRRLVELLRDDPAPEVRAAAATVLARFAYAAELGELDEDHGEVLLAALLATIGDAGQPLDVRRRALESAGYFAGSDEVQRQIELAYRDGEQLLAESALVAMGRSMLERWLPTIDRELESPSPALRYEACRAAGELAETAQPCVPRLARLVGDGDTEVALAAIWALGQIGGDAARRALQQTSKSQDDARRQAAAEALDEIAAGRGFLGGDWRNN